MEVLKLSFAHYTPSMIRREKNCKIMLGRQCMAASCSNINASGASIFNFSNNEEPRSQVDEAGAVNENQTGSY